jgi:hypothetical protein
MIKSNNFLLCEVWRTSSASWGGDLLNTPKVHNAFEGEQLILGVFVKKVLCLSLIALSTAAHALMPTVSKVYTCSGPDKSHLTIQFNQTDDSQIELLGFSRSENLTLNKSGAAADGSMTFETTSGCVQHPSNGGALNCGAIELIQVTVSRELVEGSFKGTANYMQQQYNCTMNMTME